MGPFASAVCDFIFELLVQVQFLVLDYGKNTRFIFFV